MMWIDDRPSVPCGLCGTPTPMTGTKRCDRCWELESRIYSDPALAQKILDDMKQQSDGKATQHQEPTTCKHDFRHDEDHGGACCQLCGEVRQ